MRVGFVIEDDRLALSYVAVTELVPPEPPFGFRVIVVLFAVHLAYKVVPLVIIHLLEESV